MSDYWRVSSNPVPDLFTLTLDFSHRGVIDPAEIVRLTTTGWIESGHVECHCVRSRVNCHNGSIELLEISIGMSEKLGHRVDEAG